MQCCHRPLGAFLGLALGPLIALASIVAAAPRASALSCASHDLDDASDIATLIAGDWFGAPFFDSFDLAITGTVESIETIDVDDAPDYGRTTIVFDVINGDGAASVADTVEVTASDPGWLAGYPFRVGLMYFVPIVEVGPQNEPNFSFVCDPITEMTAIDAAALPTQVADTIAVAAPTVVDATTSTTVTPTSSDNPGERPEADTASAVSTSSTTRGGINRTAALLAALAVSIALSVVVLWQRDQRQGNAGL